jgi:alpha-glucosidase
VGAENVWWQSGVIYQVYPRSFMDSSGDGVGDLPGITSKLDYLSWLGVDALWLSPMYPSPMVDFGYDVTDHTAVHPMFGTLEDFEELVGEAHRRGLRVILDYVPNHTSDEHPWFIESRSSRGNPKRDWYIWRDPAPDGGPPNNWISNFGGSAWTFDEATGQYYYHAYLEEQPDLNWRNPEVREAMYGVLRFWLERGVDGFRVDALRNLIKDDKFRDNPPNPDYRPGQNPYRSLLPVYSAERPETHDMVREMRAVLDEYDERVLIGELYVPIETLVTYYASGCDLPFNFHLMKSGWSAEEVGALIDEYEAALPDGAWPNWVLGNHDNPRVATRLGPRSARLAAVLLLTLRGTPTLYYGDELGLEDGEIPPELVQDPWEKNVPGIGLGRDPERTPMPWNSGENAGFTTGQPWLPVSERHRRNSVEVQRGDPASTLSLYRALLELRRREPALSSGSYRPVAAGDGLLAYVREAGGRRFLVALNFCSAIRTFDPGERGRTVLSTEPGREGDVSDELKLAGYEGVVVELS